MVCVQQVVHAHCRQLLTCMIITDTLRATPHSCAHGVVPLPAACHVEWVVKAASCGKHVLLEKPIAVTAADADVMVRACEEHGVQLMDG